MTALAAAYVLAASDDHFTVGDALGLTGMLLGFAAIVWALGR